MKLNHSVRYSCLQLITLKKWPIGAALASALFALSGALAPAQEPPPAAEASYEFVSGTIVELPPGRIVVNREVIGKAPENRTFLITGDTKVEGNLKEKARVTVGFQPSGEGDVAMRIIVRAAQSK